MKYDCSKILDYTHEVQRFCKAQKTRGCDNCPLIKDKGYCSASIFDITQERINFIQKWSDEHCEEAREDNNENNIESQGVVALQRGVL